MCVLLALAACDRHRLERQACALFDGCVRIEALADEPVAAQRAVNAVVDDLRLLDAITDPREAKGMRRLNALLKTGEWSSINPSLYRLTRQARRLYRATDGLYNPAILGGLDALWRAPGGIDAAALRALLRAAPTMDDIELDGIRVRSRNPAVHVDFAELRYGHAVAIALAQLRDAGQHDTKVAIGNVVGVLGDDLTGPWSVQLPGMAPGGGTVDVHLFDGESVCVLHTGAAPGDGRRVPVLDPRSGYPADGPTAVAAIDGDAADTAVACRALLVSAPAQWEPLAERLGVRHWLRRAPDGGLTHDPGLLGRLLHPLTPRVQH